MVTNALEIGFVIWHNILHLSNMDNMNLGMVPSVLATLSNNLDPHPDEPMTFVAVVHL